MQVKYFGLVDDRQYTPAQVAGDVMSVSYVFGLVDDTTSTCCEGSRPSWALVGVGCNNQLQLAQEHKP